MAKHSMDNGVPDCPECDGKGMCDKHKLEYLKYEADLAQIRYEGELLKQLKPKQERIEQNESSTRKE